LNFAKTVNIFGSRLTVAFSNKMSLFSRVPFLLAAVLPLTAGLVVMSFAGVSKSIWLTQLMFIGAAFLLVVAGQRLDRRMHGFKTAHTIVVIALTGIAAPLLTQSLAPHRWILLGPLNLYIAPLLLPSFFAACSVYFRKQENIAFTALVGASILLAIQPDASQVLALLAGSTALFMRYRADFLRSIITLVCIALVTGWAFTRPDPLAPVPYVEGVFALALEYSLFAGGVVIASAVSLIASLYVHSRRGADWLVAVAAYYATLFVGSVAGLTPAPLIGYGAGPLLGYGLMAAVSRWFETDKA
jgi:hypothetical protein